jgi:ribose 5-phosphate isomerase B
VRIAFAADDSNATTDAVLAHLAAAGHEVLRIDDLPWPDLGAGVGRAVAEGRAEFGVVMCWTGTGTAIAANKVPGALAAVAWDPWVARGARLWNDANVLAMSLKRLAPDVAVEVLRAFLETPEPDPDEAESIALLKRYDKKRVPDATS